MKYIFGVINKYKYVIICFLLSILNGYHFYLTKNFSSVFALGFSVCATIATFLFVLNGGE